MSIAPGLIAICAIIPEQCKDIPREVFEPLNEIAEACVHEGKSRAVTFRALRKWRANQDPPIKLTHDQQECLHAHVDSLRRLAKRQSLLTGNGTNKRHGDSKDISYVVVRDKTNDLGAIKAEVMVSIAVSGAINEQNLQRLMLTMLKAIGQRTDYKYYTHPTNVYIDVYTSEEHAKAEGGTWIAQLRWIRDEGPDPHLTFRKERFRNNAPKKHRFGLSPAEQKKVFKEIIQAEIRADVDAEREIPGWRDFDGWSKLRRELMERYKNSLAKRYGLTREQLARIGRDGVTFGWVMPDDVPWFDLPPLDPNLKPGKKYRLSKDTPLMPHYAPADPLQAIAEMKILSPGATIVINERRMRNGEQPWYKVTATNPGARGKIQGCINSLALIDQDVYEVP